MRTISAAGVAITFMSDEKEIEAMSGRVIEIMRGHGYSQIEKLGRKPVKPRSSFNSSAKNGRRGREGLSSRRAFAS